MKVTTLPFDPGPPVWKILAGEFPKFPCIDGDIRTDVAIVGAGFAGVSAARRLRQLDSSIRITLIEARHICDGSSGRNSGFMIDLPHNLGAADYVGQLENDIRQIKLSRHAIEFARDAAEQYQMPKEAFDVAGKVNAAATQTGLKHNQEYAAHLTRLGESHEILDQDQMHEICGSRYYLGGLYTPGNGVIKPGMYFSSFARGLHQSDIDIFVHSPVTRLAKVGSVWRLETPQGSIEADKVILTVNGHIESFGYFRRRLMHLYLFGSMTRRLTPHEVKTLGGMPSWGFTPADSLGSTVRRITDTGGDRIVIRNSVAWSQSRSISNSHLTKVVKPHDHAFRRRFPQLAHVEMEYRWGGLLCLSRNAVPAFGELEPGLYCACCQNGLGVCQGTLHGKLIAQLAYGQESDELNYVMRQPTPKKLPPQPFFSIGANAVTRWGEFRAGKER